MRNGEDGAACREGRRRGRRRANRRANRKGRGEMEARPLRPRSAKGLVACITEQMERLVGPAQYVLHDRRSADIHSDIHLDIHVVPANPKRPYTTLYTTGLSQKRMKVPPCGCGGDGYAELMITLPESWPIEPDTRGEHLTWPVAWLRDLALYPHRAGTWLGWGHTLPNGDPPAPLAENTALSGVLLLPPPSFERPQLTHPNGAPIDLLALIPLHRAELDLKLEEGIDALVSRLALYNMTEVVDVDRPDVTRMP